jgi:hypothetical protein
MFLLCIISMREVLRGLGTGGLRCEGQEDWHWPSVQEAGTLGLLKRFIMLTLNKLNVDSHQRFPTTISLYSARSLYPFLFQSYAFFVVIEPKFL